MGIQTKTGGAQRTVGAEAFMEGIADMNRGLVKEHTAPEERFAGLFPLRKKEPGARLSAPVPAAAALCMRAKRDFSVKSRDCSFALWKDNKFFTGKKKTLTKTVAAALLKEGRVFYVRALQ